jgi:cell division protease FtsH
MAIDPRDPTAGGGDPTSVRRPGGGRPPTFAWWWLAASLLVVVWSAFSLLPTAEPAARLPYSTFLGEVRGNRVTRVVIAGDRITGKLKEPISWPPPGEEHPKAGARTEPPKQYDRFTTAFPADVGDPKLLPLLQAHHVVVDVQTPSRPWLVDLVVTWAPLLFFVGIFWWMGRQATQRQAGIFGFGRTRARRYASEKPAVTFADVAGAEEAKDDLLEEVDFLRHPKKYHELGARIPRGVLLVGPPGTGKTLLGRAVAGEAGVPFFSLSGSEFVEMFVGVGASRVRDLFTQAKEAAPAIVFIDELDAVGRRRGAGLGAVNDEREQTLNQLLVEMDGFDERQEVIILAATNRPDVLDPALLRPGRFDRRVEVPLPDRKGREGILAIHTRKIRLAPDVDLGILARITSGLSGADLANLCNEATLIAARHDRSAVVMADFSEAQDKILFGGVRRLVLSAEERRTVAYHEAGHAVVAWLTPEADPVRRVTIVPHGRALGVTQQLPGEDRYNYSRAYLAARLAVMLGGRTAEELAFRESTTGAESDLVEATRLARRMVTRWGMSPVGLAAFRADEQQPFLGYELAQGRDYSEATAAQVDREVQRLLEEAHESARRTLSGVRPALDRLVDVLLREDGVGEDELREILGPPQKRAEAVPPARHAS